VSTLSACVIRALPRRRCAAEEGAYATPVGGDAPTLTAVAEVDAPGERGWELWSDPRRLDRWGAMDAFRQTVGQMDALLEA
jgi:hypothetical protein